MRATAKIQELKSDACKRTILRNLSRILDVRILDIDIEGRTISFLYGSVLALEKVKRELLSIGFPIKQCSCQDPSTGYRNANYEERLMAH